MTLNVASQNADFSHYETSFLLQNNDYQFYSVLFIFITILPAVYEMKEWIF